MRRRVRGIILLVAMVVVVALGFAGMALVRAVATTAAIGGNVNARQQAIFAASVALEHDVVAVFESGGIDTTSDNPSRNYFASRQAGEDRRGVPAMLLSAADYPAAAGVIDAGDGFAVRHVIERLCLPARRPPASRRADRRTESRCASKDPGAPQRSFRPC